MSGMKYGQTVEDIYDSIRQERNLQDAKWGAASIRKRSSESGLRVLVEEVGEVAKAINERNVEECYSELVQVAAVAIAMLEALAAGAYLVRPRAGE